MALHECICCAIDCTCYAKLNWETMANILLLEDEVALREEVASFLEQSGHRVNQVGTLSDFYPLMSHAQVAIIDINLPDGSGLDAAKRLRDLSGRSAIIMLTARSSMDDRLAGLYGGADHYLTKPFSLLELGALIDVTLRRIGQGWRLDMQRHVLVSPEGVGLELNPQEMAIFHQLSMQAESIASKRSLVETMGFDWLDYDLRRLDTLISRLRQRWREKCATELPLKTEHREGYSFGAPIERF